MNRLLPVYTLALREVVRFVRQKNRVFGALAQPVLIWIIFGAGLSASFTPGDSSGQGYNEYFYPGTVVLVLLFTSIFATISIIEDRNEGFLQGVLVAPVGIGSVVAGKVAGTTILALMQGGIMLALAPMAGLPLDLGQVAAAMLVLTFIAIALTGVGISIAWNMSSTQGFHAIMTAFLMPMWFLSGAFFPANGLPSWLAATLAINPLTYGLATLRYALYEPGSPALANLPSLPVSAAALGLFALGSVALATALAHRRPAGPDS